jgi:hypothetical protein
MTGETSRETDNLATEHYVKLTTQLPLWLGKIRIRTNYDVILYGITVSKCQGFCIVIKHDYFSTCCAHAFVVIPCLEFGVIVRIRFHCRRARKLQPMAEAQNMLCRNLMKLFEVLRKYEVIGDEKNFLWRSLKILFCLAFMSVNMKWKS